MTKFILFVLLFCGQAFGQDFPLPPDKLPWYGEIVKYALGHFPEINGWFAAVMVFMMGSFRAVSELLGFIAAKTENKTDDQIAKYLSDALRWISAIVGWFGLGKPTQR